MNYSMNYDDKSGGLRWYEGKKNGSKNQEKKGFESVVEGIRNRRTNEIPDGNGKRAWSRRVTGGQMQWRLLFNIGAAHGRTPRHISLILHQPARQPGRQTAASKRQLTETAHFPAHALHISRRINIFNTYEYCRETERHVGSEIEKEKRDWGGEREAGRDDVLAS